MMHYQLGCFGKLPIHSDFIRFGAGGEEVRALDLWLQEGIHAAQRCWGKEWESRFDRSNPWYFVLQCGPAGRALVGRMSPSRDQSGRRYPFLIYLRIDKEWKETAAPYLPIALSSFLNETAEREKNGWHAMGFRQFRIALEEWALSLSSVPRSPMREAEIWKRFVEKKCEQFWTSVNGSFEHPRKYLIRRNLEKVFGPFRGMREGPLDLGLQFPLIQGEKEEEIDIPFWFEWMARAAGRPLGNVSFFWNRQTAESGPTLMAFLGKPSPRSVLFLLSPTFQGEEWYNLGAEENEKTRGAPGESRTILEEGKLSLAAFLEAVVKKDGVWNGRMS